MHTRLGGEFGGSGRTSGLWRGHPHIAIAKAKHQNTVEQELHVLDNLGHREWVPQDPRTSNCLGTRYSLKTSMKGRVMERPCEGGHGQDVCDLCCVIGFFQGTCHQGRRRRQKEEE